MNIKIGKSIFKGTVNIPSSKSDVHRLLIAAALADQPTKIYVESWSEDSEVTKKCLEALGGSVQYNKELGEVVVIPISYGETSEDLVILDCGESGSTLRFILPIIGALGKESFIEGHGRLPQRPIGILLEELRKNGCVIQEDTLPLSLQGQLKGGKFTFPGNISSQFITGLLLALPILKEDSQICLTSPLESKGYVDMTLQTLKTFGIYIEETPFGYDIKGGQNYSSPKEVRAQGDWSSGAFWVVAGAIISGAEILLTGIEENSNQGDKEIISLMKSMGANITWTEEGVICSYNELKGISIDASQIPDLVPILCTAGALAEGKTYIYNAGRVRIKESDRLQAMAQGLKKLGVLVIEEEDSITIERGEPSMETDIVLDSFADHRIAMSLAIAVAALGIEAVIEGAGSISKSYPRFFTEFVRMGGIADVI